MCKNVFFIHSSGKKNKDLSLERIGRLAQCRTTLFPMPSGLGYELGNDATAENSMHTGAITIGNKKKTDSSDEFSTSTLFKAPLLKAPLFTLHWKYIVVIH